MKHKRFIDLALDAITKAKGFGDCRYTQPTMPAGEPEPYCVVGQFAVLAGASVKMMSTCTGPAITVLRDLIEMNQLEDMDTTQISLMLTLQHIWDKSFMQVRDEATARDVMFLKLMDYEADHG